MGLMRSSFMREMAYQSIMLRPTSSPESMRHGAWRTRLVLALRRHMLGPGLGWHELEKLEHRQRQGSLVHPLGSGALWNLA
jgi:hypothetical protein